MRPDRQRRGSGGLRRPDPLPRNVLLGGIAPDVELPPRAPLPAWWSSVADSALDTAVVDSVVAQLPPDAAARNAWLADTLQWRGRLLEPLLARARQRFAVPAPAPDAASRIADLLAARAARVRWGEDARQELLVRHDPDIAAALGLFNRGEILAH